MAIVALSLSVATTLFSAGYNYRKLEEVRLQQVSTQAKIDNLERTGSVAVQVQANDIQWLKEALKENNKSQSAIVEELRSLRGEFTRKR